MPIKFLSFLSKIFNKNYSLIRVGLFKLKKTNPNAEWDLLFHDGELYRMSIYFLIVQTIHVVITIETKAFFHKKRGLHGPFGLC
ncbi:hypothetical protein BHG40_20975 [Aeromonas salmonicida subsp. masoucida]|nr:hypothetical protein BHG40_20975 [Aeromonas salmonicida subsp. masoucida]